MNPMNVYPQEILNLYAQGRRNGFVAGIVFSGVALYVSHRVRIKVREQMTD